MPTEPTDHVDYPESDGMPMSETDLHYTETVAFREAIAARFASDPAVYVAGNNFLYFERGNPRAVFSPDVYVVRGVEKRLRRSYKLWEEGVAPCFVMEISSRSTWLEDIGNKKALCARLGVAEYFLYDPEGDVVRPPLQGFTLRSDEYERIAPGADGSLRSIALGVDVWLDDQLRIHVRDASTGKQILRPEEARRALEGTEKERDELRARLQALEARLTKV